MPNVAAFPLGASVSLEDLERDPHSLLATLREREPVSWLPALGGWLVTRHDLARRVMRDAATFTVEDSRFSTAQVIGPSMLSVDGEAHDRNRAAFGGSFRPESVRQLFTAACVQESEQLLDVLEPAGGMELRRAFAGPLAALVVTRMLGFDRSEVEPVLAWYDAIVAGVTAITAGDAVSPAAQEAFAELAARLGETIDRGGSPLLTGARAGLTHSQTVSNLAVLLFGGIETTEGMIANAVLALLEHPASIPRVRADPRMIDAAIDESLRMEPAAAVIDRYAVTDVELGSAQIVAGELVRISISAANRDPSVFSDP